MSLDSLDDATFRAMNDVDFPVAQVLEGIDAAAAAGLAPIKINMVVKRGMNEASIVPMARHFRGTGHIVRFIEYMDVGAHQRLAHGRRGARRARSCARSTRDAARVAADPNYAGEVAERWRYRDGSGEIGVIASVTQAFCRDCTRARLSTDGKLYTCLFATDGYDLRALLRGGRERRARSATRSPRSGAQRADRYSEIRTGEHARAAEGRDELHRRLTPRHRRTAPT